MGPGGLQPAHARAAVLNSNLPSSHYFREDRSGCCCDPSHLRFALLSGPRVSSTAWSTRVRLTRDGVLMWWGPGQVPGWLAIPLSPAELPLKRRANPSREGSLEPHSTVADSLQPARERSR